MNQRFARKSLWTVRELGLPTLVRACPDCPATRHRASGRFRLNANGKLLDAWLLVLCAGCGRTSKVPVHERVHVRDLSDARRLALESNDPALVRELLTDASLAERRGYTLDWSGTWALETDVPFLELDPESSTFMNTEILVHFEHPARIRLERLLMEGLRLSRGRVRDLVDDGVIVLPDGLRRSGKVGADFGFCVVISSELS